MNAGTLTLLVYGCDPVPFTRRLGVRACLERGLCNRLRSWSEQAAVRFTANAGLTLCTLARLISTLFRKERCPVAVPRELCRAWRDGNGSFPFPRPGTVEWSLYGMAHAIATVLAVGSGVTRRGVWSLCPATKRRG